MGHTRVVIEVDGKSTRSTRGPVQWLKYLLLSSVPAKRLPGKSVSNMTYFVSTWKATPTSTSCAQTDHRYDEDDAAAT